LGGLHLPYGLLRNRNGFSELVGWIETRRNPPLLSKRWWVSLCSTHPTRCPGHVGVTLRHVEDAAGSLTGASVPP